MEEPTKERRKQGFLSSRPIAGRRNRHHMCMKWKDTYDTLLRSVLLLLEKSNYRQPRRRTRARAPTGKQNRDVDRGTCGSRAGAYKMNRRHVIVKKSWKPGVKADRAWWVGGQNLGGVEDHLCGPSPQRSAAAVEKCSIMKLAYFVATKDNCVVTDPRNP